VNRFAIAATAARDSPCVGSDEAGVAPTLAPLADGIWTSAAPHRWIGLHLGTRMTVVRLSNGSLLLHSPVPIPARMRDEILALGPVAHVVCPNRYHHVYAAEALAAFPGAKLHGPRALRRKRRDLVFDFDLSEEPHRDWKDDLAPLTIHGCLLCETVFFHHRTRTLVTCDLVENFTESPHGPTDLYLRLAGLRGRVGWSRFLRPVYRDRKLARASIDRILAWPIERVIVSHGSPVMHDAAATVRRAFAWL
jgi:hypothetical protein